MNADERRSMRIKTFVSCATCAAILDEKRLRRFFSICVHPRLSAVKTHSYGLEHAIDDLAHLRDPLIRGRPIGRFGDDPHDWLCVAGAGVDPAVGPVDADAVLG